VVAFALGVFEPMPRWYPESTILTESKLARVTGQAARMALLALKSAAR